MSTNDTLLSPINVGGLELINRVVMAPMTRNQSPENIPTDANVEYYRKRAAGGVGLIVTEGTCVDHIAASGYPGVPYIHGDDRLAGWKRVVEAVHAEGGKLRLSSGTLAVCAKRACCLRAMLMVMRHPV